MLLLKKVITYLFLPSLLFGEHIVHINIDRVDKKEIQNKKIKCYWVCNKKVYREKEIEKAISFYESSKYYNFEYKKNNF